MRIYVLIACLVFSSCRTYHRYDNYGCGLATPTISPEKQRLLDTDSDNDGVVDYFDKCPNTPDSTAVTVHGCILDTDGDGVADNRDKELNTPEICQPSNKEGIGLCPSEDNTIQKICDVSFKKEWVRFNPHSFKLDANGKKALQRFAEQMKMNPTFTVLIIGYGNATYSQQQVAWSRVMEVKEYMVRELGIDRDRFILRYGLDGSSEYLVELKGAGSYDQKLKNLPPPYPGLVDKKNKKVRKWRP